jgi:hypothetical protein
MAYRGYSGSSGIQTAQHRAGALLAAFAIFLHVAIPTLYDLAPPKVQGLMQITICSGGEARQIVVDESGKPVKEAPSDNHNCHSCVHHCGVAALGLVSNLILTFVPFLAAGPFNIPPRGFDNQFTQARAPPL